MDHFEGQVSREDLTKRSGLSRRTLDNLRTGNFACTLRTVEGLAKAFGVEPWEVMLPDLPAELVFNGRLRRVVNSYIRASADGQRTVEQVAELVSRAVGA